MDPLIANRRSIRKYKDISVEREMIEQVLQAGLLAPSAKNRQPWIFTVVSGKSKNGMLDAMARGIDREENGAAILPNSRQYISGAEVTLKIMAQAPVTVFIWNTMGLDLFQPLTPEDRIFEICNAQSIGAAIENMSLAATGLGLGSLWICDTFFAYHELKEWLNGEGELFAAMTLGYADETPFPRPRNPLSAVVEWKV